MARFAHDDGKMKTWIKVVGIAGFVSLLTLGNTAISRWNSIPGLQNALSESQADSKDIRAEIQKHESQQAVDMTTITMTLKSIDKTQTMQQEELRLINRKLDRMPPLSRSTPTSPNENAYSEYGG